MELNTLVDYYQNGRFKEAEKIALDISKTSPSNQLTWKILAAILLQNGRLLEALEAGKKSVSLSPMDAEAKYNLGVIQYKLGNVDDAINSYSSAIATDPSHTQSYINLGILQQHLGRLEDAVLTLKQATLFKFDNPKLFIILGNIQHLLNKFNDAETNFLRALKLNPYDYEVLCNLGIVQQKNKKLKEAEDSYRKSISIKNDYFQAICNLGTLCQELGKLDEAISLYEKSLKLNSNNAAIYNNLGNLLVKLDKIQEAKQHYFKATLLDSNYSEAFYNLGISNQKLENFDEAEKNYIEAINLKHDYADAFTNLGIIYHEKKKYKEAEEKFKKSICLKPDNYEAYLNLANTYQSTGFLKEAEENYKKTIKLNSNHPKAIWNLLTLLHFLDKEHELKFYSKKLEILDKNNYGLRSQVILAILSYLEGDIANCNKYLLSSNQIQNLNNKIFKNEKVYHIYLSHLLKNIRNNITQNNGNEKTLHVIGESHSLVSNGLKIKSSKGIFSCKSSLIMGCKQFHLGDCNLNKYQFRFKNLLQSLPQKSEILLSIGEIDCRINSGILDHIKKNPKKNKYNLINDTIKNYLNNIQKLNVTQGHVITIQGVPCPNIDRSKISSSKLQELISLINDFNNILMKKAHIFGFSFLDLHSLTDRGDGYSNGIYHLDTHHLTQEAMLEAWKSYFFVAPEL